VKILLVDDDKKLLEEVAKILTRNGHSVDCADNAAGAVAMVKSSGYDFVLVDYRMPEHDGLWFLKNAALPRRTKALLVTSYVDRQAISQMFKSGISGYVVKPFDESELLRHLQFHSENRTPLWNTQSKEV
jgi:DNA-binding response OmpR family regulator